jgi:S-DNA-T family DNA segregation ATPase FtsK/SpoIIIE
MDKAVGVVAEAGKASASYLQRRLKIGYNRAARLVEEMEERGIVGPQNGSKPREILHIPEEHRE